MVALSLSPSRSSIAASRARLKNCESRQSKNQASEATRKTNQCSRFSERHQGWAEGTIMLQGIGMGGALRPNGLARVRSGHKAPPTFGQKNHSFTGLPVLADS